jgi:hypothetical protein
MGGRAKKRRWLRKENDAKREHSKQELLSFYDRVITQLEGLIEVEKRKADTPEDS